LHNFTCTSTVALSQSAWHQTVGELALQWLGHNIRQLFTLPSSPVTRFGNSLPASTAHCQ